MGAPAGGVEAVLGAVAFATERFLRDEVWHDRIDEVLVHLGEAAGVSRVYLYQNVRSDGRYPRLFLVTSTRDDRVHPGHARKMMARMKDLGFDVRYYENIEGGHSGAADNAQTAYMTALAYIFLWQKLK